MIMNLQKTVAQSRSTDSLKPKLSMIQHVATWNVDHVRLCTHKEMSPESNSVKTLQRSFG